MHSFPRRCAVRTDLERGQCPSGIARASAAIAESASSSAVTAPSRPFRAVSARRMTKTIRSAKAPPVGRPYSVTRAAQ